MLYIFFFFGFFKIFFFLSQRLPCNHLPRQRLISQDEDKCDDDVDGDVDEMKDEG
jgi:hypothetical protein